MAAARKAFPLLVPEDLVMNTHSGFVTVFGKDYVVRVWRENDKAKHWNLEVEPELRSILHNEVQTLQARLFCEDLQTFLEEFQDVIEKVSRDRMLGEPPQAASIETIITEIMEVGWDRVVDLSDSFQVLHLRIKDAASRSHILEVEFPESYPKETPKCRAALPKPFVLKWEHGFALRDVVSQFQNSLHEHQKIWDVLDDFDHSTWVLEPERPTRDVAMRRIAIGNHCSMQVNFDPARPHGVPEVRFLGADSVIVPLRERLNQHLVSWDEQRLPRVNLEGILQRDFPARKGVEADSMSVECAICYTYRLDGALPDIVCDNSKCARPFHGSCLYEWLRAVPTTRQAFNTIFGSCTYCGQNISLPNVSSYH